MEVYRGSPKDGGYGVTPYVVRDSKGRTLSLVDRPLDTFHSQTYVLTPKGARRLAIPSKASVADLVDGRVIIQSQEAWSPAGSGKHFPAGSLLSVNLAQVTANPARLNPRPFLR